MKKWKRLLLTGIAACTVFAVSASAASFDSVADTLKSMGLFAGTSTGYELDRAPTRAEAATMLVRLLGKTAEAEAEWAASKESFAFRDMDDFDWAQPYVHWLARNGLTAGTSADRYSPAVPCTAQMYAAFLMRALGYSEADGDFSFDDVLSFARSRGVINSVNCDEARFLRDHVVATSYTALASAPKSGESDLLTKLANSGSVDATAAAMEQLKFSAYRSYAQVMQPASEGIALENVTSISVSGDLSLEIAAVSETRLGNGRVSSQNTLTMNASGTDPFVLERTGYYADERWYVSENGVKTWKAASLNTVLKEISQPEPVPIVFIDGIRTGSTNYTLTYNTAGRAHYLENLKQMERALGGTLSLDDLSISDLTADVTVENGVLTALSTSAVISGELTNGQKRSAATIRAQQNSKVLETGSGVTVNVPEDLASYAQAEKS